MNPKVDAYLSKAKQWQMEMSQLRLILLEAPLTEDLKWGKPCYSFQNTNLFMIQSFKEKCALGFFNGALLKDDKQLLLKPGENTQAGRYILYTHVSEIVKMKPILKAYIKEAIALEKAGIKVVLKKNTDLELPIELTKYFEKNPPFKKAFYALTPGRQRAYHLYFTAPKQSKTIESRIENKMPAILNGKGFHDCTCGHSQKMPYCDGSHKNYQ